MLQFEPGIRVSTLTPAKINLTLRIVGQRSDGYHLLHSEMAPISLYDRIALTFLRDTGTEIRCRAQQKSIPEDDANLAAKAARLFLNRVGVTGRVSITIDKDIPSGAGLGGGSSDAAATLRMLSAALNTKLATAELARWAVELGADVPFFVHGCPARVGGIGEQIRPQPASVSGPIVVAFPGISLSTADVYRAYDASLTTTADLSSGSFPAGDQGSLNGILINDLEAAAMRIFPRLRLLKNRMLELGACGALMTGSGSAVFGIWKDERAALTAAATLRSCDGMWARSVGIIERTPEVNIENLTKDGLIDGR